MEITLCCALFPSIDGKSFYFCDSLGSMIQAKGRMRKNPQDEERSPGWEILRREKNSQEEGT
jgi:hypothetical protein